MSNFLDKNPFLLSKCVTYIMFQSGLPHGNKLFSYAFLIIFLVGSSFLVFGNFGVVQATTDVLGIISSDTI